VKFEDKGKYTCEVSNSVGLPQSYNIKPCYGYNNIDFKLIIIYIMYLLKQIYFL